MDPFDKIQQLHQPLAFAFPAGEFDLPAQRLAQHQIAPAAVRPDVPGQPNQAISGPPQSPTAQFGHGPAQHLRRQWFPLGGNRGQANPTDFGENPAA